MKKLFNIALLFFLVTSCSKDDDSMAKPQGPVIPADKKYISRIDRWENNIIFDYDANKKVHYIYFGVDNAYTVVYQGDRISQIFLNSNIYDSYEYKFGYNDAGQLTGYFIYTLDTHEMVYWQALVHDAATNSYNGWLYLYDDGSIKRTVIDNLDRTLVYDTSKRGAFANIDQKLIMYLMFINRRVVLWPAYIGKYPCKEIVDGSGVLEMENTYDAQGFITNSHMDSTLNNLNSVYTYIEL